MNWIYTEDLSCWRSWKECEWYSIIILYKVRPTVALDTPACCRCEVRCCGGPHLCPWSAGETPGPTSSGWWAGPGGNRERPCVYIT